jgi:hypothetical protein
VSVQKFILQINERLLEYFSVQVDFQDDTFHVPIVLGKKDRYRLCSFTFPSIGAGFARTDSEVSLSSAALLTSLQAGVQLNRQLNIFNIY